MEQNGPAGVPPWPPGMEQGDSRPLYSQQLKIRIQKSERLNRNVLEINLEKERSAEAIEDEVIEKLLAKIGITMSLVEGVQAVPKRFPKKVFVWFKDPSLDLNQFCKEECYKLGTGVKTGIIRPMDRKEVEVTIKSLNLNTPDSMVLEYLALFGKVVKNVAVYVTNKEGPFAGLKNGDRKYMMDFTGGKNLGTYHLIDGANVHISYPGQRRTCARCQRTSNGCPGGGLAKRCEENGGGRITLRDHMQALWEEIGFKPAEFTLENEDNEVDDDVEIRDKEGFTPPHKTKPKMSESEKKNLSGVSVRNLPLDIAPDQAQTFLETVGLPEAHTDITITKMKYSTTLDVEGLTPEICSTILANIEGTVAFGKKIYCKGIITNLEETDPESVIAENPETKVDEPEAEVETPQNVTTPVTKPQVKSIVQKNPNSIPGLHISKTQEKKLKQKKDNENKKEEDFVWSSLQTHPIFNAHKDAEVIAKDDIEKKRNAASANLSPQDRNLAKSKNLKTR